MFGKGISLRANFDLASKELEYKWRYWQWEIRRAVYFQTEQTEGKRDMSSKLINRMMQHVFGVENQVGEIEDRDEVWNVTGNVI